MVLFWDKNLGKKIPKALKTLKLGIDIEYYREQFPQKDKEPENGDDFWMKPIGENGWAVTTQDYELHKKKNELFALKQYSLGCFYIWGGTATRWEIMRCFAKAYDRILEADANTPKPYVYRILKNGTLKQIELP